MIDIIIPAYNSQDTIVRTLCSIGTQLNKDELKVTIVNDGGKDYKEIVEMFKPILNLQEIGYEENMGPGYARQYGIDHTDGDYIIFIDADDTFHDSCSVPLMVKNIKEGSAKFLISPFIQVGKQLEQRNNPANLTWVFGHVYERNFLDKHNIRFTSTRANEDVGFNYMVFNILLNEYGPDSGKVMQTPTYDWQYNEASITRRGKDEYEYGICIPGYIYNLHNSYDVCVREGVPLKNISRSVLESLFSCFIYYNVALSKEISEKTIWAIETLSRKFYYAYYKQIQDYISKDEYKASYTKAYASKGTHLNGVIFKMTLEDFIELMFSKPEEDITYEQIEKEMRELIN